MIGGSLFNTRVITSDGGDGHRNELAAFRDAIASDGPSPVPAEQSLAVARILEGLYVSAEAGSEIRI